MKMSKSILIITIVILLSSSLINITISTTSNLFSSLIRNNLNRYLKNPLFTRSFVMRNSLWQNEFDDGGGSLPLSIPSNDMHQLAALETFDGRTFNPNFNPLSSNFIQQSPSTTIRFPSEHDHHHGENKFNRIQQQSNLKSLTTTNNNNAYSTINNQQQQNNKYVDDQSIDQSINNNQYFDVSRNNRQHKSINKYNNNNNNNHSNNENKNKNYYNQEKALNLKLEYGFKPLPVSTSSLSKIRKNFISINSIQIPDDPIDDDDDDLLNNNDNNNNRTMKSLIKSTTTKNKRINRLKQQQQQPIDDQPFSHDYKKYISYPMETESSDNIHKLAFNGVESFRPDNFVQHLNDLSSSSLSLFDTISNYPNIKNFPNQGIECARQSGYCEYDSSYPIDYVNSIITNCTSIIDNMYIEMPENMNDFYGYKTLFNINNDIDTISSSSSSTTLSKNRTLCDAERKYIRPSVIKDIHGIYYLILQSSFYFQQIPVEICINNDQQCNYIDDLCSSNGNENNNKKINVKCKQQYRTVMLISIEHHQQDNNDNNKIINCPKMRMYRLPSSCVCEISN